MNDKKYIYEDKSIPRPRIVPTHYIEVFRMDNRVVNRTHLQKIYFLETSLNLTKSAGYTTLWIWKIKLKNPIT